MKKFVFLGLILLTFLSPHFVSAQSCSDPLTDWIPDFNDPLLTVKTKVIILQNANGNGNFNSTHINDWVNHISQSLTNLYASVGDPIIGGIPQTQMQWYQDTHIRFSLDPADIKFVQSAEHWDPIREFVGDIISTSGNIIKIPYTERNEEAIDIIVTNNMLVTSGSSGELMWMEIRGGSINDGLYTPQTYTVQGNQICIEVDQPLATSTGEGIADFDCPLTVNAGGNNPQKSYICEYGEDRMTHLNILVTGRSFYYPATDNYGAYHITPRGNGSAGKVVMNDLYEAYLANNNSISTLKLLAHEVGHALGLEHTHALNTCNGQATDNDSGSGVTDTPADYGCQCDPQQSNNQASNYHPNCSNNLMGYNTLQTYISPLQAAKMYRSLNCGLYFLAHPCTDLVITTNQTIDVPTEICGHLIVEQGATLIVNSPVKFNEMSKVIVKKGGTLILNSHFTGRIEYWQGIEIEGSANLDQSPANQGSVIVNSGGWIRQARVGVRNHLRDDQGNVLWNTTGGIIQVNGGRFQNNRRHVIFLSYHGTGNTLSNSYFDNAQFRLTNMPGCAFDGLPSPEFVSIYDVDGVRFMNCQFSNFSPTSAATFQTGTGLALHTADVVLEESVFQKLNIGLQAVNAKGEVFLSNLFEGNKTAIQLSESDIVHVNNNTIIGPVNPDFGGNISNGIEVTNVKRMHLKGNHLEVLTNGIIVDNTGEAFPSSIYNNVLSSCLVSLLTKNDNSRLFVRCNDFQGGAAISTHWINSGSMQDQGTCSPNATMNDPASNLFTGISPSADIFNLGGAFQYVHHAIPGSGYTSSDLTPSSANNSVALISCTDLTDPFDDHRACVEVIERSAPSSLDASAMPLAVNIFPNPSRGLINLELSIPEAGSGTSQVFDLSGKLIKSIAHGKLEAGEHKIFLNFDNYHSGTYLLKFTLNETSILRKLILIK